MLSNVKFGLWILGTIVGNIAFFGTMLCIGWISGAWMGRGVWPSEFGPMAIVLPASATGAIVGALLIWKCELPLWVWLTQPTSHDRTLVEQYYK